MLSFKWLVAVALRTQWQLSVKIGTHACAIERRCNVRSNVWLREVSAARAATENLIAPKGTISTAILRGHGMHLRGTSSGLSCIGTPAAILVAFSSLLMPLSYSVCADVLATFLASSTRQQTTSVHSGATLDTTA